MSDVVAQHLSGFHTVSYRYRDETVRMATGDSENEIRRRLFLPYKHVLPNGTYFNDVEEE